MFFIAEIFGDGDAVNPTRNRAPGGSVICP
jgi:hypothetical protein